MNHIPGIYNYCDRWCDKCAFTHRCLVFQREMEYLKETGIPDDFDRIMAHIDANFSEAMRILHTKAEKFERQIDGLDVAEEPDGDLFDALTGDAADLVESCRRYAHDVEAIGNKHERTFLDYQDQLSSQLNMGLGVLPAYMEYMGTTTIIEWYQHFIYIKSRRAASGLREVNRSDPVQNDANGSAKVLLIACRKSAGAWRVMHGLFPGLETEILGILSLLQTIMTRTRRLFPRAEEFVRPGFDE